MTFVALVAVGVALGWRLGVSRPGLAAIGVTSLGATVWQITHLLVTTDRSQMTMLPIVAGALVVGGQLLGTFARRRPGHPGVAQP